MFWVICIITVVVLVVYLIIDCIQKVKLRNRLKGNYFDFDNIQYDFEKLNYISKYWEMKKSNEEIHYKIDDITWNDLEMDYLFFRINATQSSIGEEYLYAKLRETVFNENKLKKFGETMDFFDNNLEIKTEALCSLYKLGKNPYNNIHSYIYEMEKSSIKNVILYYILMFLSILSGIICFFSQIGFFLLAASLSVNILVYYKNKLKLEISLNSLEYISKAVCCASELSKLDYGHLDYKNQIIEAIKPLKKLNTLGNSLVARASTEVEILMEYVKSFSMWDFINYDRMMRILSKQQKSFHKIYKLIGELDCALAVSEYRKSVSFYCSPVFCDDENIVFGDVFHPFIKNPTCNSIEWNKNTLITGSNASGKSTFIKALAINMICSQSIYICFARKYRSRMSFVVTSMAIRDKIFKGESYFIAEIKSLKRVLDEIGIKIRIACFIDEILKGTNTIERIAASASVLYWLKDKNCVVMAATHDIELTKILDEGYDNYFFKEEIIENSIVFDYKLCNGVATTRNAVQILKLTGYNEKITNLADKLADDFEENKRWTILEKT